MEKMTKTGLVRQHLELHGEITSWEAIQKYAATRLSAIIFNLKKEGMEISTELLSTRDDNGLRAPYAKYHLIKEANNQ